VLKGTLCLVTGGAGFIGSHLVDCLAERGAKVRILDNLATGRLENVEHHLDSDSVEFIEGSVIDVNDVKDAMRGVRVVFHLACLGVRHSLVHPFENHRVNAEGTLVVLNAAREEGVERFLYCSSSEVYGTALNVPMSEDHPTYPCTVYGAGKLAGEAYARAFFKTYGMHVSVIRPFNSFGPRSHYEGDSGEVIPKTFVRALGGTEILVFGDGTQTRDFTYVEDTARGLVRALECEGAKGETLNMGSGFEIPILTLVEKIRDIVGNPDVHIVHTPERPGDVLRLYADSSRMSELCGWIPEIGFDEGLRRTLDHFRSKPEGFEQLLKEEKGRSWE
jgi:UDP-glucose 4-epimerase